MVHLCFEVVNESFLDDITSYLNTSTLFGNWWIWKSKPTFENVFRNVRTEGKRKWKNCSSVQKISDFDANKYKFKRRIFFAIFKTTRADSCVTQKIIQKLNNFTKKIHFLAIPLFFTFWNQKTHLTYFKHLSARVFYSKGRFGWRHSCSLALRSISYHFFSKWINIQDNILLLTLPKIRNIWHNFYRVQKFHKYTRETVKPQPWTWTSISKTSQIQNDLPRRLE